MKREIEHTIVPLCEKSGVSVLAYGVLGRGILSSKYHHTSTLPKHSRATVSASISADLTPVVLQTVGKLDRFAKKREKTLSELAIAWVLGNPNVASVILGVRNSQQLRTNLHAVTWNLTKDEISEVDRAIGDLRKFQRVALGSFYKKFDYDNYFGSRM